MRLYEFYKEVPKVEILTRPFRQLILPTEVVIREIKLYVPQVARSFFVDYFALKSGLSKGDVILSYGELLRYYKMIGEKFPGTSNCSRIELLEWWEDVGDDGHCVMNLSGWVSVLSTDVEDDFYVSNKKYDFSEKHKIGEW